MIMFSYLHVLVIAFPVLTIDYHGRGGDAFFFFLHLVSSLRIFNFILCVSYSQSLYTEIPIEQCFCIPSSEMPVVQWFSQHSSSKIPTVQCFSQTSSAIPTAQCFSSPSPELPIVQCFSQSSSEKLLCSADGD